MNGGYIVNMEEVVVGCFKGLYGVTEGKLENLLL
jgi:hypothetical protein